MIILPSIDPVAFSIGPVAVHWYGLSYLAGIFAAIALGRWRVKGGQSAITADMVVDMIAYVSLFAILGGRLGYAIFYDFGHYVASPADILKLWQGGMSFHGGLAGSIAGLWLFCRHRNIAFFMASDFLAPMAAIGFLFGRLANFVNQELWGRPSDVAWAVVFPSDPAQLARHPSQLYEATLEGALLFIILWVYSSKKPPRGAVSGMFLLLYGLFRFAVEFVREPDAHLNFVLFDWTTMGQLLSAPVIVLGICIWGEAVRGSLNRGK